MSRQQVRWPALTQFATTFRGESGRNRVAVVVADTGPGLTEEAADKLYEPLFSTKPDGMGLGLSISRSIIKAHEGTVSITNLAAAGVVAKIELPKANVTGG